MRLVVDIRCCRHWQLLPGLFEEPRAATTLFPRSFSKTSIVTGTMAFTCIAVFVLFVSLLATRSCLARQVDDVPVREFSPEVLLSVTEIINFYGLPLLSLLG